MTDMRALLRFPGERRIAVTDCPVPALSPGTILVRTEISVISNGTERQQANETRASLIRKAWQRPDLVALTVEKLRRDGALATINTVKERLGRPMVTGYANCGLVVAMAPDVTEFDIGQRVACAGLGHANHAEYNIVPRNLASPVPNAITGEKAAFATLYAIALHAIRQGELVIGHRVAVVGCGLIGQLVTQTAIAAGAIVTVVEPVPKRREMAMASGASNSYAEIRNAPADQFDAVLICISGNETGTIIEAAAKLCRDRGIIVCVGDIAPKASRNILYRKEITIRQVRSYGPGRYDPNYEQSGQDYPIGHVRWTVKRNMKAALTLIESGKLDPTPLVSQQIDLEDAADFLAAAPTMATIIRYQNADDRPKSSKPATQIKTTGTMRIGLIGAGNYMTGTLLPRLRRHEDTAIKAIVSQSGLSALAIKRQLSGATALSVADDILAHPDIDTVFIATRHDSHAELACKALNAGKHLWLEKPLCVSREQLESFKQIAEQSSQQVFMVGHNRRFAPMTAMLKKHLPKGKIQFRYQVRPAPVPTDHWVNRQEQGGRTIGEISHFIDLLSALAETELLGLQCDWINREAGDSIWHMSFADGSRGEVSYLHAARRNTPKEVLEVSAPGFAAIMSDWRKLVINGTTVLRKPLLTSPDKGHDDAIAVFLDAIKSGIHDPRIPGIDAEIHLMDQILAAASGDGQYGPA
ncbi:bi-domain-containing oxidoreductase [Thalassospira australica]|uniref:bi-domain-containing oxidoreductase n=1 Tax=Thalassospira australica TaxID=1528106 RepID=UPI00384D4F1B